MDTYQLNFAGLLGLCAVLFIAQRSSSQDRADKKPSDPKKKVDIKEGDGADASQWPFLTVFALVMASDWLQVCLRPLESRRRPG